MVSVMIVSTVAVPHRHEISSTAVSRAHTAGYRTHQVCLVYINTLTAFDDFR